MSGLITGEQIARLNPLLSRARAHLCADVLDRSLNNGQIASPRRVRHYLAQIAQETGGMRGLVESTAYRDPVRLDRIFTNVQGVGHARRLIEAGPRAIANTIYANKLGNGGVASGDGHRYRGRGFLQVTGRANYRALGALIKMPLEEQPDLLGEPEPAAEAAASFWGMRRINAPADVDDIATVTRLVNGPARMHLEGRKQWLRKAAPLWSD